MDEHPGRSGPSSALVAERKLRVGVTNVTTFVFLLFVYLALSNTGSSEGLRPWHLTWIDCTT